MRVKFRMKNFLYHIVHIDRCCKRIIILCSISVFLPYKICTPVNSHKISLLSKKHPDRTLVEWLTHGFKFGFSLCYKGPECSKFAPNLKSARDLPHIAWEKIKLEVQLGRIRGPFSKPPFEIKFSQLV